MVMTMTNLHKTNAAVPSATMPVLPTRDDYRDGMNKLRERLNCPVLSVDEQALADDLLEYDWSRQPADAAPSEMPSYAQNASALIEEYQESQREKSKRPSVDEYLKQQYQQNMLARYPDFECRTDKDIAQIKQSVDQLYVFNAFVVVAVVLGLVAAVFFSIY